MQSLLLMLLLVSQTAPQAKGELDTLALIATSTSSSLADQETLSKREGMRLWLTADPGARSKARLLDPPDFMPCQGTRFDVAGGTADLPIRGRSCPAAFPATAAFQPRAPPAVPVTVNV